MKRNPLYVFENVNSVGINTIPLKAMIQINDMDGAGHPVTVQLIDKTDLESSTTIGEFLATPDKYNISGDSVFIHDDQIGVPGGVAALDANGKVPGQNLPSLSSTNVHVVNSENAMIALNASEGDQAVRLDAAKSFIKVDNYVGQLASWVELSNIGTGPVQAVNGKSGNITLTTLDITEDTNLYYTDTRVDNRILAKIDDNSGLGSLDMLWSSNKTALEIQTLTFDDTVINGRIQSIENDYARVIADNNFLGLNVFQQGININGDVNIYKSLVAVEGVYVGVSTTGAMIGNSVIQLNNAHPTKPQVYIYLDNTDDVLKIDDSTGNGNTLYHSGNLDPSLKVDVTDGVAKGTLEIIKGGNGNTAALTIKGTTGQDTDLKGVFQAGDLYFTDTANGDKYGIKVDNTLKTIDFKVNEVTSLTLEKNIAPMTQHAPTNINHLTRKDYVDTKLSSENGLATGVLELSENPAQVAKFIVKKTTANDSTVIQPGSVLMYDSINKYSIKTDELNNQLDLKINDITSMSLSEGVAPTTQYTPLAVNSLTRKDYVDNKFMGIVMLGDNTNVSGLEIKAADALNSKIVSKDSTGTQRWAVGQLVDADPKFTIENNDSIDIKMPSGKALTATVGIRTGFIPTVQDPDLGAGETWQDGDVLIYDATLGQFIAKPYAPSVGATSERPVQPTAGTFFFDLVLDLPIWYAGGSPGWIDATGTTV